jgi:hypothetical protein
MRLCEMMCRLHDEENTMPSLETELEMCQRHIREGALRIDRQQAIIDLFVGRGHDPAEAEHLLAIFQHIQRCSEDHLARLKRI